MSDLELTGETTPASRRAALAELEAVSRIQARTGVTVRLPWRRTMPGAERSQAIAGLEATSKIAARKGAQTASQAFPARRAFDAALTLLEAAEAGRTDADDELKAALREAVTTISALAVMEAVASAVAEEDA